MKKLAVIITIVFASLAVFGQEKGSFITISGGVGPTGLQYTPKGKLYEGYSTQKIGGHATLGYSYFFTKKVGIATGIGVSYYRTIGGYDQDLSNDNYLQPNKIQTDDDKGEDYFLRVRLGNWEEQQKMTTVEIPLMMMFQHKFGKYQRHGIYLGLGAKLQIPIKSTYTVLDGAFESDARLNVSGYYPSLSGSTPQTALDLGAPDNDAAAPVSHGFGSISNPHERLKWEGDMSVQFNIAGTIEGGFLFGLGRRVDMNIGAFLDYGFKNIQKGEPKELVEAPDQYQPNANGNIGYGIAYNGLVNSNQVSRVNTISYGGKIGIRIKLGKLEVPTREQDEENERLRREEDSLARAEGIDFNNEVLKAIKELQRGMNDILTWRETVDSRLNALSVKDTIKEKSKYPYGMTKEEYEIVTEENMYFSLNSAELQPNRLEVLNRKVEIMKKYPQMRIQIMGNTCDLGSAVLNGNLGLSRAKAVRAYMVSKGISDSRIAITTHSYNYPLLPNTSEENRSKNRRCDFEVVGER